MPRLSNPYRDWLGLPNQGSVPNHYELLGIEISESREVEIRAAYYRRVAKVSIHQHGADATACQELLKELVLARDVLLNPKEREAYRRQVESEPAAEPRAKKTAVAITAADVLAPKPTRSAGDPSVPPATATATAADAAAGLLQSFDFEKILGGTLTPGSHLVDNGRGPLPESHPASALPRRVNRRQNPFGMLSLMRSPRDLLDEIVETRGLTPYQSQCLRENKGDALVVGPYIIESEIGAKSWGPVFLASRISTGELVSLRLLASSLNEKIPQLRRTIQRIANFEGEGLQCAVECGVFDDQGYLASELIRGESLSQFVARMGPLSPHQAIYCIDQAAKSLAVASNAGCAHLALRPSKLMLTRAGRVAVRDLALAELMFETKPKLTSLENLAQVVPQEQLDYCAPEILVNDLKLRSQADVYSLGCMLFFCLTGNKPYDDNDPLETIVAHRESPTPSVCEIVDGLPKEFDELLARMLAKKPSGRFSKHSELRQELRRVYQKLPKLDRPLPALFADVLEDNLSAPEEPVPLKRYRYERVAMIVGIAAAGVALLFGIGTYFLNQSSTAVKEASQGTADMESQDSLPQPGIRFDGGPDIPVVESEDVFRVP